MPLKFLSKDEILAARDRRSTQIVAVPEWFDDGFVIVIELSGRERDAFEAAMIQLSTNGKQSLNLHNIRAKLAGRAIVDPADFDIIEDASPRAVLKPGHSPKRLFNDMEINDLGDVSASALQRVFDVAQQLSGITQKDVEELTEDLKNVQSGNSGTN